MNKVILSYEFLRMRRSIATISLFMFVILASSYSIWSGMAWQTSHQDSLSGFVEQIDKKGSEWRSDLEDIESGKSQSSPYVARPMDINFPAIHVTGPTSHLAIGMTEILPARLMISPRRNGLSMIEAYEFDNPMTLLFGRMDFVFFVTVIVPLLLIALNFDVIASDRARGLNRMLLSNPITESSIISNRMAARTGLLLIIILTVLSIGLYISNNLPFDTVIAWIFLITAYIVFWYGLIFLVVSKNKKGFSGLSNLVSLWLFFVLIIPAASNSITSYLYPQPSKLELLSDARSATSEATKQTAELTQQFLEDHPELTIGDDQVPGYYRALFLSNSVVKESTKPIVAEFTKSLDDRENMLDVLQYLSPTTILQRNLIAIAQTDSRSHALFIETATQHVDLVNDAVEDAVLTSNRISVSTFDQIPSFQDIWEATEKPKVTVIWPITFMLFLGLALISLSRRS